MLTRNLYSIGLLACLLSSGCDGLSTQQRGGRDAAPTGQPASSGNGAAPVVNRRPIGLWDASACGDDDYRNAQMQRHPDLFDRSAEELLTAYGRPRADERFAAGSGLGTYRGGIANQLPGGALNNAQTMVREIVWQRKGCDFIVRFRELDGAWRVFDAFEAATGSDF